MFEHVIYFNTVTYSKLCNTSKWTRKMTGSARTPLERMFKDTNAMKTCEKGIKCTKHNAYSSEM